MARKEYLGYHDPSIYNEIAALPRQTWLSVKYTDGRWLTFQVNQTYKGEPGPALIRFHPDNPLATRQLRFKTGRTVKNAILKEGHGATPVAFVIDPYKSELEWNRPKED